MRKLLVLLVTHVAFLAIGFALGIYALPILVAPDAPDAAQVESASAGAQFTGEFRRDAKGSDLLHWGEGKVSIGPRAISLMGRIAPGPDYKLYLSTEAVEDAAGFLRVKANAVRVGDIETFENFIVAVPESIDVSRYTTVIVWCESFSQFIASAKYR